MRFETVLPCKLLTLKISEDKTMQKSSINYKGVDYPVRTLDIRSIPSWGAECYANARIGDIRMNMAFEDGDKEANAIDDSIVFYIDKSKLEKWSDKKLLSYLKLHLF